MKDKYLACPHCNTANIMTNEHVEEMQVVGKAVFTCNGCNKLFVLRDDGDGEYIYSPPMS